ncbi:hypothetical protein [Bifidobacterium callitrichos]|uniref:Uncharacterized protein n=1 Tax=Bifidobacterium callitrichos DSM 23973 TaxID=1437609 RepID=A0A086ZY59_9BIFI|nr:hypothetical protein [Bifidobacterium callitrichos]KFI51459.1 hypothetical protein BCAL_1194 [Bifidobacterium callitrichos DSM 23973]
MTDTTPTTRTPADIAARNAANALATSIRRDPAKAAREMGRLRREAEQWRGRAKALQTRPESVTTEEWDAMTAEQKAEACQIDRETDRIRRRTADIEAKAKASMEGPRGEIRRLRIESAARRTGIDPAIAVGILDKAIPEDTDETTIDRAVTELAARYPYLVERRTRPETAQRETPPSPNSLERLLPQYGQSPADYRNRTAMNRLTRAFSPYGEI